MTDSYSGGFSLPKNLESYCGELLIRYSQLCLLLSLSSSRSRHFFSFTSSFSLDNTFGNRRNIDEISTLPDFVKVGRDRVVRMISLLHAVSHSDVRVEEREGERGRERERERERERWEFEKREGSLREGGKPVSIFVGFGETGGFLLFFCFYY